MNLEATNANVPREPGEIPTPLDAMDQAGLSAMLMMIALDNWLVRIMFVSTHAVPCLVESMPFAFLKGMQLGADARVVSQKTRKQESVSVNVKA